MKSRHFAFKNQKSQRLWGQCCVCGSAVSISLVTLYTIPQSDLVSELGFKMSARRLKVALGWDVSTFLLSY